MGIESADVSDQRCLVPLDGVVLLPCMLGCRCFKAHLHTEKRMLCYSIQQHFYQVCSGWCSDPCNSYDGHSLYQHLCLIICIHHSCFICYQQLPSVLLLHHACYSLFLQTATVCSQHTCIILLHQTDTALTTQQTVPAWYRQFWTVCRREQSDTAMISYLYQAWRRNRL